jgi:SPP1 family predicted phage head-tail adaptor
VGAMRHPVTIQTVTESQNATTGAITETWSTYATAWASLEPLTARELFAARQTNASVTSRVRMRYVSGLNPKMRLLFGSRYFVIDSILNLGELNAEHELLVHEVIT